MNLIPKIAKELGVEIGEEFEISGWDISLWKFDMDKGLMVNHFTNKNMWCEASGDQYMNLINGEYIIRKLPFEPKKGEKYFVVSVVDKAVWFYIWDGHTKDYCYKACGNCFRTEAEAEKHKYEIYEKLTGRKWEE